MGGTRCALIVAPHPDDEIIGAAGLILSLKARGARVTVAVVSDGAASHPGSLRWPKARLVAARRRESLRALRRLGIPAGDVRFLGLPDGRLHEHEAQGRRMLHRVMATDSVDLIVGPAEEDAHPDHRAVARALKRASRSVRHLTYQVWPARGRTASRIRRHPVRGGVTMKRSLIRMHRTQLGMIRDDPGGFAIAPHELRAFGFPVEMFVEARR